MLNNYKYNERGDMEITVELRLDNRYMQKYIRDCINQPDNKYYVRCGNVIVSVCHAEDVAIAIMSNMLSHNIDYSIVDITAELLFQYLPKLATFRPEPPEVIEVTPLVWVSNDKKAIEQVKPRYENEETEQLFKLFCGLE